MLIARNNFTERDFSKLPVSEYWNHENKKEYKMHKIHAYPAKFPAFITSKSIDKAEKAGINVNLVADIFCGCGTTAYKAMLRGKNFWGCDINPIATLIARTKVGQYNTIYVKKYLQQIERSFQNQKFDFEKEKRSMNQRILYWFDNKQIKDLLQLKKSIELTFPGKSKYKKLFICGFSNILKLTSRWLQKSIKPTIDKNKKAVDVFIAYKKQMQKMLQAIGEHSKNDLIKKVNISINTANILEEDMNKFSVDLVISSPPYVTSYEYADLHQLSLLWVLEIADYRELRNGSIGSSHNNFFFEKIRRSLNNTGKKIVDDIERVDKSRAKNVAKYFIDIQKAIQQASRLLRPNGMAVFVIGNTEYKQVHIDNAKHLIESMFDAGFSQIYIEKRKISNKILTPYRTKKGRFSSNKNSRKIYAEEFVVNGVML